MKAIIAHPHEKVKKAKIGASWSFREIAFSVVGTFRMTLKLTVIAINRLKQGFEPVPVSCM